ncbi:MAG: hypothetical protein ACR2GY_01185 [Phycisphaerales bacterium]
MPTHYPFPTKEADLAAWSNNFSTKINAFQPLGGYGLTPQQCTDFETLNSVWIDAYEVTLADSTRTAVAIVTKRTAKNAMIENARTLVALIQADPATTDTDRAQLEITIRDNEPTPVPVITTAPTLSITSTANRSIKFRLKDAENPDRRGKPTGAKGATVMMYVGETPPLDPTAWTLAAQPTNTIFELNIPAAVPAGSTIWFTAMWVNTKLQPGNASTPLSTSIGAGVAQAA